MEDRIRELEIQVMGLSFLNEMLMDKIGITTKDIQNFAIKCLDNLDSNEKNTDLYYSLMEYAYQENTAGILRKDFEKSSFKKD
ncbi:hypothetical protein ATZ33_10515 [Enterococcus silesiacus]|uniref:Uncharacterized protein n=1 Tax=Enterococcus silesiacus TaxID=332949 RepID=A0A0S3KBZ8_9ENTE|nr:hypothetical protein [Enterococcus silesiacus]ALS01791.1 hypothetical protein ATZ33_10515 [Enterococcus silesiacus]OJG92049.1 hypothetical protein RV15_GL003434 [Enterococcus silesiacus]